MPLPDDGRGIAWPPEHCQRINRQIGIWAAWYGGKMEELAGVYGGETNPAGAEFFASEKGGFKTTARRVYDRIRRWFWGNRNASSQPRNRVHVPLAGDIAAASADLIFSEPPTVTVDDDVTQERVDELMDDGAHATLLEAAEIAAGLGGVYLRVCWDPATRADRPWLSAVHPDAAVPEWSFDKLVAVTFWRVIHSAKGKVVRHLERHEPGQVFHGVYEGDDNELGRKVPLTDYTATAGLADDALVEGDAIDTGIEQLAAVYVPNMRPNRVWRGVPEAAPLGRSDYAGVEPLMDSLDLTYSSWMRDVELGKARLIVPAEYMQSQGRGQGAALDLDREIYEPVSSMGSEEGKLDIKEVQFTIRVDEHQKTILDLKTSIVGAAGYSAQTFGLQGEIAATTATEVVSKDRRSLITRDRKIRYWRPGLADITEALLGIDKALFGTPITPQRPSLEWPDGVSVDPEAQARTLQSLDQARAISIEQKVKTLHPDWEDDEVTEEVQRIMDENGMNVENPDTFTGLPPGPPQETNPAEQEVPA